MAIIKMTELIKIPTATAIVGPLIVDCVDAELMIDEEVAPTAAVAEFVEGDEDALEKGWLEKMTEAEEL